MYRYDVITGNGIRLRFRLFFAVILFVKRFLVQNASIYTGNPCILELFLNGDDKDAPLPLSLAIFQVAVMASGNGFQLESVITRTSQQSQL